MAWEHDNPSTRVNRVVVSLVRDEKSPPSMDIFTDTGQVAGLHPIQLVPRLVAQAADKLHGRRFVGPPLGDPSIKVGEGLASPTNLSLHVLQSQQHDKLGILARPAAVQREQVLLLLDFQDAVILCVQFATVVVFSEVLTRQVRFEPVLAKLFDQSRALLEQVKMLPRLRRLQSFTDERDNRRTPGRIVHDPRDADVPCLREVVIAVVAPEGVGDTASAVRYSSNIALRKEIFASTISLGSALRKLVSETATASSEMRLRITHLRAAQ